MPTRRSSPRGRPLDPYELLLRREPARWLDPRDPRARPLAPPDHGPLPAQTCACWPQLPLLKQPRLSRCTHQRARLHSATAHMRGGCQQLWGPHTMRLRRVWTAHVRYLQGCLCRCTRTSCRCTLTWTCTRGCRCRTCCPQTPGTCPCRCPFRLAYPPPTPGPPSAQGAPPAKGPPSLGPAAPGRQGASPPQLQRQAPSPVAAGLPSPAPQQSGAGTPLSLASPGFPSTRPAGGLQSLVSPMSSPHSGPWISCPAGPGNPAGPAGSTTSRPAGAHQSPACPGPRQLWRRRMYPGAGGRPFSLLRGSSTCPVQYTRSIEAGTWVRRAARSDTRCD